MALFAGAYLACTIIVGFLGDSIEDVHSGVVVPTLILPNEPTLCFANSNAQFGKVGDAYVVFVAVILILALGIG